ncbi:MAG TPA: saccharopine dehydrogenase C-terminal domain-containing protein, partial [Blastocatellia bacterium]
LGAAYDLSHSGDVELVTIADLDFNRARSIADSLNSSKVTPRQVDVNDHPQVMSLMRGQDAAISCVTYHLNLRLAHAAVDSKVNFCDLGGNNDIVAAELALDQAARSAGINIIPDCGLAPGMVSILVARGAAHFQRLDSVRIRVGGVPQRPLPPLNYQIVFSVEGLINEYVERARVVRDGRIVEVDSMTEVEALNFPQPFGRMEAFHTSGGISTLPNSFLNRVKDMDYKTIRYSGHCEKFKLLIDLGLTSSKEIQVDGARVNPRHVLEEVLLRALSAEGPDVVLVRVEFEGAVGEKARKLRYDIIDYFDPNTGLSAMMRTTAFPASVIAQMMARGEIQEKGATPQECCVPPESFVAELDKRNIRITETIE